MSNQLDISCPECKKSIKATAEMRGKKVRCKGCGHIFAIPAAAAKAAAPAVDDDDPNPYGMVKEEREDTVRCPHCAKDLDKPDAVICVNCGYNLRTRQRIATKKTIETTSGDRIAWLMPGFVCLTVCLLLIGFDLFYCFRLPNMLERGSDWEILSGKGVKIWVVVISVLIMVPLSRFAFRRLIMHPTPPEQES